MKVFEGLLLFSDVVLLRFAGVSIFAVLAAVAFLPWLQQIVSTVAFAAKRII
jgi:hypothetical protein